MLGPLRGPDRRGGAGAGATRPCSHGGVFTRYGATVQPARLARGLRRVLLERGVRIHERTPVSRFGAGDPVDRRDAGRHRSRRRRRARAERVGAALEAVPPRRSRCAARYIVLTAPAPDQLAAIGWTDGDGLVGLPRPRSTTSATTPDGRIAFGVGGMQPDLARHIDPRFAYDERVDPRRRSRRPAPDVPDVRRRRRSRPRGAARSTSPAITCRSSARSDAGTVHYGLGYTGQRRRDRRTSAGRILAHRALAQVRRRARAAARRSEPRGSRRSRSARWARSSRTARSIGADESLDDGEDPNPFVDFVAKLPRRLGYNLGP